jgi:TPR repeat protein
VARLLGITCDCGGHRIEQDFEEAVERFRQAANHGIAKAQRNSGNRYSKGQGVQQDFVMATQLFQQSADQGFTDAQFNLCTMRRY